MRPREYGKEYSVQRSKQSNGLVKYMNKLLSPSSVLVIAYDMVWMVLKNYVIVYER